MSVGKGASAHRLDSDGWSISSSSVKIANNKIPVSSVFNDSERLYRTTQFPVASSAGLIVPRGYWVSGHVFRFFPIFFLRFATEMPWTRLRGKTPLIQELDMAMSTVALEKNRELLFIGNVFYKQWHISACCFTSISRARPLENRKY